MKQFDNFILSIKNLFLNFSKSLLTLILLIILLTSTIFLSIFVYSAKQSVDTLNFNELKEPISIGISSNLDKGLPDRKKTIIPNEEIEKFIVNVKKILEVDEYSYRLKSADYVDVTSIEDGRISLNPIIGCKDNIELIEGETPKDSDIGVDNIWLSSSDAKDFNLKIGDTISIATAQGDTTFNVKGITKEYTFVDYKYVPLVYFYVIDYDHKDYDLKYYKTINSLNKTLSKNFEIVGTINFYKFNNINFYKILAVFGCLILFCFFFSVNSIISAVKMNIASNTSIGVMTALGMKDRDIFKYVLYQVGIVLIIASFIATCIAVLMAKFTLLAPLQLFLVVDEVTISYNFLISLINFVVLAAVLVGYSFISIKKYLNGNLSDILERVEI
ncbi:MAG: ABC transporter permease [Clostridia bacterium]